MTRTLLQAVVVGLLWANSTGADEKQPAPKDSLEGTWKLTSVELNGQPLSMEKLQDSRLVVKGAKYSFKLGDTRLELTHVLLTDQQPKGLDLTVVEGAEKGKTFHGIYKLDGSTLTICRDVEPGKERPKVFATKPESGLLLVVWTRDKT